MSALPEKIISVVCISGMIVLVCIRLLMEGDMASFIPKLAVFAVAAFRIIPAISRISVRINSILFYRPYLAATYENVTEVREYEKQQDKYKIDNSVDENVVKITLLTGDKYSFKKELKVDNVWWKYDNAENAVLKN